MITLPEISEIVSEADRDLMIKQHLQALDDELQARLTEIGGCSNHGCYVVKPVGQGTNGRCHCLDDRYKVQRVVDAYKAAFTAVNETPLDMVLHCPKCHAQHIDRNEWATRPHKTHLCEHCGNLWRPCQQPTCGVEALSASKDGAG